ncbi:hypothetical protein AB2B38_013650 [Balneola sp. MJW-20]|uniref:hypothetical protein n=1 Tax=Gracilimonas aurantiaca TaxID=3234185 RepID=UPI003464F8AE
MKIYKHTVLIVIIVSFLTACIVGERASKIDLTTKLKGEIIRLTSPDGRTFRGEFLGFKGDYFVILPNTRVALIHSSKLRKVELPDSKLDFRVSENGQLVAKGKSAAEVRSELLTHSRYPQDIDDDLLKILLEAYDQDEALILE